MTLAGNAIPVLRAAPQKRVYDADQVDAYVSHLEQSCSELSRRLAAADTIVAAALERAMSSRHETSSSGGATGGPWPAMAHEGPPATDAPYPGPDPIFLDDDRPMPWELDGDHQYPRSDEDGPSEGRAAGLALLLQRWRASRSGPGPLDSADLLSPNERLASLADGSYLGELQASSSDPFSPDGGPIAWPEPTEEPTPGGRGAPGVGEPGGRVASGVGEPGGRVASGVGEPGDAQRSGRLTPRISLR